MATAAEQFFGNESDFEAEAVASSPEALETEGQVALVCRCYDEARGDEVPAALIRMLGCLIANGSKFIGPTLTHDQADRMLAAGNKARGPIRGALEPVYSYDKIRLGLDALLGLECHWSETNEGRAARTPDIILDLADLAAIFGNDLRNILLSRAIRARAAQRLDDHIAAFHPVFREIMETEILDIVDAKVA